MTRISVYKDNGYLYSKCHFCDGFVPVKLDIKHFENLIEISGTCKKCSSKFSIVTNGANVKFYDEPHFVVKT